LVLIRSVVVGFEVIGDNHLLAKGGSMTNWVLGRTLSGVGSRE
jgi:hypothetical protein